MVKFEHGGIDLAYDFSGRSEDEVVVLLHGLGSARSTWDPLVPRLAGRRRVLTIDHRGHGESSHAPGTYTLEHYVPDAIALCEGVAGGPALWVGHSLGGVVAASVARHRPDLVQGLVLEDPPLYRGEPGEDEDNPALAFFALLRDATSAMQARRAPLEEYVAMVGASPSPNGAGTFADVLGEQGTRARAQALASLDPGVFLAALDGSGLAGAEPDAAIGCPVRVLRADPALGAAFTSAHESRFLAANPDAHVVTIGGASHFIHDEQPDRFLEEFESLLAEL